MGFRARDCAKCCQPQIVPVSRVVGGRSPCGRRYEFKGQPSSTWKAVAQVFDQSQATVQVCSSWTGQRSLGPTSVPAFHDPTKQSLPRSHAQVRFHWAPLNKDGNSTFVLQSFHPERSRFFPSLFIPIQVFLPVLPRSRVKATWALGHRRYLSSLATAHPLHLTIWPSI